MFKILNGTTLCLTRGDVADIQVTALQSNGSAYTFQVGDVVRFKVFGKKACDKVVIQKDVTVEAEAQSVTISLAPEDTKLGSLIHQPVEYWYEVELNPDTRPQTIIGFDDTGEKLFVLYPEGSDSDA